MEVLERSTAAKRHLLGLEGMTRADAGSKEFLEATQMAHTTGGRLNEAHDRMNRQGKATQRGRRAFSR